MSLFFFPPSSCLFMQSFFRPGMRRTCQVLVYIDLARCLCDGIPFVLSANGVVLSPGDAQGTPSSVQSPLCRTHRNETLLPMQVTFAQHTLEMFSMLRLVNEFLLLYLHRRHCPQPQESILALRHQLLQHLQLLLLRMLQVPRTHKRET